MPRLIGFMASWATRALSAEPSTPAFDTRKPAAIEMIRAGIWLTRPSPMVMIVYDEAAWPIGTLCWTTPIRMPPMMLMATMIRPATASPRTNLLAPSMAPKKVLSCSSSLRRFLASFSSMRPAERSASMAICLPGIASSVKRAETSAMRSAPLVITTKLMTTRMLNTIRPTAKLPPIRK
ncbi:hypothetical protein SDC9_180754 [bioreactor metagenome]|uniref:Uncharacterized protein n=1 Tax=bioreactor metagenome TaxID=1076179 RepID=A0A645H5D7_9ZZZZ